MADVPDGRHRPDVWATAPFPPVRFGRDYALERYAKEVRRLYGVLNRRLTDTQFMAGDSYSIADIATYPWIARFELHGLSWDEAPQVKRWFDAVGARAAVMRGMAVPAA